MWHDSIKHSGRIIDRSRAPRTGRGARVSLVILTLYSLVLGQQSAGDYQVEATYLYNFAKSAQWPEESLPHASSPIVIGVVGGDDEFIETMKRTLAGKTVGTHPVVVERASTADDLKGCNEILIRKSAGRKRAQAVISNVADENILLVGEDETFLQQGGMINMVLKDGRVQFAVDGASLDRAKI